jgi:hypothetical protein
MRTAGARSRYREELDPAPKGVAAVLIDTENGMLAGPDCPLTRREYFIAGTEPTMECTHDVSPEELPIVENPALITVSQEADVESKGGRAPRVQTIDSKHHDAAR